MRRRQHKNRTWAVAASATAALVAVLLWPGGGEPPDKTPAPIAGAGTADTDAAPRAPQAPGNLKPTLQQIRNASLPPSDAAINGRERLVIKHRPGVPEARGGAIALLAEMEEVRITRLTNLQMSIVEVPVGWDLEQLREVIGTDASVVYVSRDTMVRAQGRILPNDPNFNTQHNLDNPGDVDVDAPEAWAYTTGSEEVVVVVIDSGIDYSHADLQPNLWVNSSETAGNRVDDDNNGYVDDVHGVNAILSDPADPRRGDPWDDNGHGTWVASVIGARGNNNTLLTGVNWNVRIMSVKALGYDGRGPATNVVRGIDYIIGMKNRGVNIKVVNASYGGESSGESCTTRVGAGNMEYDAIDRLRAADILFVTSAGNGGLTDRGNIDTASKPNRPACYNHDHLITVASHRQSSRHLYPTSNYGPVSVDIAAPGRFIPVVGLGSSTEQFPQSRKREVTAGTPVYFYGAETTATDWIVFPPGAPWARTTEQSMTGLYSWTDSPGGNYADNNTSWIRSPTIDLSAYTDADYLFLSADIMTDLEYEKPGISPDDPPICNFCDSLQINMRLNTESSVWRFREIWSGATRGWRQMSIAIPTWAYTREFVFRFLLNADGAINRNGVYIDNIRITRHGTGSDTQGSLFGTSFSSPHVAGAAALLWAHRPDLAISEVRAALLDNVDTFDALAGRVASGGTLNIANALFSVTAPGLRIHASQTTVAAGSDGYLSVSLTREPRGTPANVILRAATTTPSGITGITPALTFTNENWHRPQRIDFSVRAGASRRNGVETLRLSVDAAQSDPDWAAVSQSVAIQIDVGAGFNIHTSQTTVREGARGHLDVSLTRAPQGTPPRVILRAAAANPSGRILLLNNILTFTNENWRRAQRINFAVRDDDAIQPTTATETLRLSVIAAASDPAWAAVSQSVAVRLINDDLWDILNNDAPRMVSEGSSTTIVLVFNPLAQDTSMTVTAAYAPAPDANAGDHTTPAEIRAAAGSTDTRFAVHIIDDEVNEVTETILLQIRPSRPGPLGTQTMRVTLQIPGNDPPTATLHAVPAFLEEGSSAVVSLRLDIPPARDVAFNIRAEPALPGRYSLSRNLLAIAAGTTQNAITLSTLDNNIVEPGQTITLTFRQSPGLITILRGAPSVARVGLYDDLPLITRLRVFLEGAITTGSDSRRVPVSP